MVPIVRLKALVPGRATWAKLEYVHPAGSIYGRVADAQVIDGRSVVIAGSGAWCLALWAAHAKRGVNVACVVALAPPLYEHRVLLESIGVPLVLAPADTFEDVVAAEVASRGAVRAPVDAAEAFARTVGAELMADRAAIREGPPDVVVAPDDDHGLVEGLRRAGLRVIAVRRAPGSRWLEELRLASPGSDACVVDDEAAAGMRREASHKEGLLLGHASAAVLYAALAVAPERAVALLIDAGDRVFSRDREAAA